MHFSTLFFDLDATLYPPSNGLWEAIRLRIFQYMEEKIGLSQREIPSIRDHYWKTYGTTLEGLRIHHQIDPEDYLRFVHQVPLDEYLSRDPELHALLSDLPQDLWIFTNADSRHAEAVLAVLGIREHFEGIVDLLAMDYVVKPKPEAYRIALEMAGEDDPTRCMLFDDLLPNLLAAKEYGFTTVLVGGPASSNGIDYHLPAIHKIREILPHLWRS